MATAAAKRNVVPITQKEGEKVLTISPPNFGIITLNLVSTAPYVQLRFSEKTQAGLRAKMALGSTARSKRTREAREYTAEFERAYYRSSEGWYGVPASSFRQACISACRTVGFKMTLAKLSIFIIADGFDATDGTPLVRLNGEPRQVEHITRNANGQPDIRVRAMWDTWKLKLQVRFDRDQFTEGDIINLMSRVGQQVGIGEGRPDSKNSSGMGWGVFSLV